MRTVRALVADDDPATLEMVTAVIERLGIEVTQAATGDELLEGIAEHGPFDVIVTDISMPWMTGLQVMHSVRTAGLPCPVVVMTGLRDPKIREQVATLGTRAVLLTKPFSLLELYAALEAVTRDEDVDLRQALHPAGP